jgi:hypothetical protein
MSDTLTTLLPPRSYSQVTELHPNVQFQWLHEGRAFAITITSSTREAIDVYIAANIASLHNWPANQPFFSLQDVSHPNVTITPYFRRRLEEVTFEIKKVGLSGHSVIVLATSIAGNLVRLYGRIFARKAEPIHQDWVNGRAAGEKVLAQLIAS